MRFFVACNNNDSFSNISLCVKKSIPDVVKFSVFMLEDERINFTHVNHRLTIAIGNGAMLSAIRLIIDDDCVKWLTLRKGPQGFGLDAI